MNLVQLRQQLRTVSGRFDLVGEDGSDTGIGFYITGAINFLNTRGIVDKPIGRLHLEVPANVQIVPLNDDVRLVKEVYIRVINQGLRKLIPISKMFYDLWDKTGSPVYFVPAYFDFYPTSWLFKDSSQLPDEMFSPSLKYNSIVLFPYSTTPINLEVGVDHLHDDVAYGSNYWLTEHSELLVMAVMRQLEIFHRNTQGVNDWTHAIEEYVLNLRQELVHEEALHIDQMSG